MPTRESILSPLPALTGMSVLAAVKVEKIAYKGWPNCYRVSNGEIEAIVTGDVGPRVIRFAFVDGRNLFKEYAAQLGKSGEPTFQVRGGSRVWKAPEDIETTWAPDNVAVTIQLTATGLIATAPVEPSTNLQKEIEIRMDASGPRATVLHRITNRGPLPLQFSTWVLTMMAEGGLGVSGFPPRGTHPANLSPTNPLVMWAYTDLSDPRWKFTKKYLTLRQDSQIASPQKLGTFSKDTWAVYFLDGEAFVKRAKADPAKSYADFGCSFETFTNDECLEVETLGPMIEVQPEQTTEHVEQWGLFRNAVLPAITDDALTSAIEPLLRQMRY